MVPDLVARLVLADILMRCERDGLRIPKWAHDLAQRLHATTKKGDA